MDQDDELWRTVRKAQDKSSVDTLMLKYRPIAPKPTATTGQPFFGDNSSSLRRTKRKYVRVSKNNKATCRSKNGVRSDTTTTDPVQDIGREDPVTLQLLPERSTPLNNNLDSTDTWQLKYPALETWVTVESFSFGSAVTQGSTDEEITDALNKDTCPGFVSDGSNHVVMVNEAYRRIVTGDDEREVIVWLVVDQTTAFHDYRSFTCKVRLEYTWRETKYVKTVPCDVWKMEFGGYAWRLDTTKALTLWL